MLFVIFLFSVYYIINENSPNTTKIKLTCKTEPDFGLAATRSTNNDRKPPYSPKSVLDIFSTITTRTGAKVNDLLSYLHYTYTHTHTHIHTHPLSLSLTSSLFLSLSLSHTHTLSFTLSAFLSLSLSLSLTLSLSLSL